MNPGLDRDCVHCFVLLSVTLLLPFLLHYMSAYAWLCMICLKKRNSEVAFIESRVNGKM